MNKYEPISVSDAVDLGRIMQACRGDLVSWLDVHGNLHEDGVVRCVGDENGNMLRSDEDVRDAFLRISLGMEYFIPIPTCVEMLRTGHMAFTKGK